LQASECAEQNGADKYEHDANGNDIPLQGKVHGKPPLVGADARLARNTAAPDIALAITH
jgi:hypothetical protein